ncbi:hypothetical protein FEM03_07295 [Phragmitibacter flavus]|uniref:Glycine zipper 2TM domain-containing protein n=1 Tax=Phragmitibacter flavus TaxID=2576071 RepID=A0A5R8KG99_9BACT|nr:hypothetical protein [Phragmitibacter flavus]TLD71328.1 hypothetical protein FEM03_07295 [Phragmitibacter flavus]
MKLILLSIGIALFSTSCSSTSRLVTSTLAAAGGAALGHSLSDGNPLVTAASAGGGFLLGEAINHAQDGKAKKSYTEGYDKGRSDAVKQQYWLLVDQQKKAAGHGFEEEVSLYQFPLPAQTPDGALFPPGSTRTLRIEK